jgi:esterase FrsA
VNDLAELKRYVAIHAKGQDITGYERLLDRIRTDGDGPGSWAGEWCAEGDRLAERGKHLEASRYYIMARFPFVDGPARRRAYEKSLESFAMWRAGQDIHRVDVDADGLRISGWHSGLSKGERKPLLVVMGGFLTVKEQWAPALSVFSQLGLATIVTEMPGVGENEVPYDRNAWRFLSRLLDGVADRADVSQTYALAMSFSGHLALRCAMEDSRIKGVITVGAPVNGFFTDTAWQKELPRVTVDTLNHLTGGDLADMRDWALTPEHLSKLDTPVAYVASLRDEVIPPADPAMLRAHVPDVEILSHDDVHGSPSHLTETKLWLVLSLARMRGVRDLRTRMIGSMWHMVRAGSRVAGVLGRRRRGRVTSV